MKQTCPFSSAAERNRQPILERLQQLLPKQGTVLEIGSGTGQHAVFFSRNLPGLLWQPSDREENLAALEAIFSAEGNEHILPVLKLDVTRDPWPGCTYDAAYSANTAHIMPWNAVVAMFSGVSEHIIPRARFCLYGPFNIDNRFTSESNARFDAQLRAEDPDMGIRDMAAIESLAGLHQMRMEFQIAMPANNFILVFSKL
jgi:cyclopropane fatty-acyl-phospholipid synthase-like methyltransferase